MPVVSMFYGLIIRLYFFDTDRHNIPHIHVEYAGAEAIIEISTGSIIEGALPSNNMKLLLAWMEIHQEEIMADWALAAKGESVFKIEPLR